MRNKDRASRLGFIPLLLLLSCPAMPAVSAGAQDDLTGAFEGIVTDGQTNLPVKSAVVEIKNQESGIAIQVETDLEGKFFYARLRPGPYVIRVAKPQYEILELSQNLSIGPTTGVFPDEPLALKTASIRRAPNTTAANRPSASPFTRVLYLTLTPESTSAATPERAAAAPTQAPWGMQSLPPNTSAPNVEGVDPKAVLYRKDGEHVGSFTPLEVQAIPVSSTLVRNFDDFASLLPGVAPPPQTIGNGSGPGVGAGVGSAGQFAVNGMRARDNNFTVDGSDNNDEDIGVRRQGFVALNPQPIESIQEYQVVTLLAPAQYGRNIGAQVNAVSKSGGNRVHGTAYGLFNSSQLNARNFFDSTNGSATTQLFSGDQPVVRSPTRNLIPCFAFIQCFLFSPQNPQPVLVRNGSGGEDSFTLAQGGFAFGGPLKSSSARDGTSMFYFLSGEGHLLRAAQEASFAVPTVAERGIFGTGATSNVGVRDIQGAIVNNRFTLPVGSRGGNAIFSLFPFPNNPDGLYGPNTFTQTLPANAEGKILSGRYEANFKVRDRLQSLTARYNFTDDRRDLPVTGGSIFSTLRSRVRTQNISIYANGEIGGSRATRQIFNQLRLSYGRTRLDFKDIPDREYLVPSGFSDPVFGSFGLINAPLLENFTSPTLTLENRFVANRGSVFYRAPANTIESIIGPVGQVSIAGYSPVGVDVFNFPQRRVNNTYQLADSVTWHTGEHNYVFGADLRRTELNSDLPRNTRPLITFNGVLPLPLRPRTGRGNFLLPLDPDTGRVVPLLPTDLAAAGAPSGYFLALGTPGASSIALRYYHWHFFWQDEWRIHRRFSLSYGLRYEYNTPPREASGRIERTFDSADLNFVPGLRRFIDGRTRIFDPDYNNFAPRFGFAYSPRWFKSDDRTTVLRGGYGLYYDQIPGAVVSQSRNVFPNFVTVNLAGGSSNFSYPPVGAIPSNASPFTLLPPSNPALGLVVPGTINVINITPFNPLPALLENINRISGVNTSLSVSGAGATLPARRLEMPMAHHYSLTLDQQLGEDVVLSVSYVGTRGNHLLRFTTPNLGPNAYLAVESYGFQSGNLLPEPVFFGAALPPGARVTAAGRFTGGRPERQVGPVNIFETTANSRYNALQLQLRGRFRRSLQYMLGYTWSKAVDDVSDVFDLAGAPALPQNSFDLAAEHGPANFDVRHRMTYYFIYDFPELKNSNTVLRALFNGVRIAGAGRFNTGQPFTVNSIFDVNLDGNLTDRLNTTDGLILTGDRRRPLLRPTDDPAQLATTLLAPVGSDGQVKRNSFRAGNVLDLNLAVSKSFRIAENRAVSLRCEAFNFINRANFGVPVRYLEAPGFGQAKDTVTPARRIQFGLKYEF
jgi:Carboxypeptidase regulatory-like domain